MLAPRSLSWRPFRRRRPSRVRWSFFTPKLSLYVDSRLPFAPAPTVSEYSEGWPGCHRLGRGIVKLKRRSRRAPPPATPWDLGVKRPLKPGPRALSTKLSLRSLRARLRARTFTTTLAGPCRLLPTFGSAIAFSMSAPSTGRT
jgi:hypothetical protein